MNYSRGSCPICGRSITIKDARWSRHLPHEGARDFCDMSLARTPVKGDSAIDYYYRATQIADLATQVRDCDPAVVWNVLTTIPADELQRLMMLTLAGIDIDRPIHEIWSWVLELPASKVAS